MVYAIMAERKPPLPSDGEADVPFPNPLFDNCLLFFPLLPVDVGKIRFCLLLEDWNVIYGSAVQCLCHAIFLS